RLSLGSCAGGPLRRLSDGGARLGGRCHGGNDGRGQAAGHGQVPYGHRRSGSGGRLRRRGRGGRRGCRRPRGRPGPQGPAPGSPAAGKSPRPATRLRSRLPAQSRASRSLHRAQWRRREHRSSAEAPGAPRWRDDGTCRLPRPVASAGGRSRAVRRGCALCIAEGGGRGPYPLYRARTCTRRAAQRRDAARAGPVPWRTRGTRLSPPSCDRGIKTGRGRGCVPPGARSRRGYGRPNAAQRRGLIHPSLPSEQDMVLGVPVSELVLLATLIIIAGFITGILAGLFGIGGGALIVPVLYEVFRVLHVPDEVRFQLCVGTSIGLIVPTNVLSYLTHRGKGAVMTDVVRAWAVPAVVGVAAGSAIAAVAPAAVLKLAFVVIASVIAFKLLVGRDTWRLADDLPGPVGMTAYGVCVGLASSLMGISGGSVSNMILTLYGKPIHK